MQHKERIEQINFMNWVRENYPDIWEDTYHFANERRCSVMEGRNLKKMGVKKGVSDIFVAVPYCGLSGLWIELKAEGGRLSEEQKEFITRMNSRGYLALAVWGADSAKAVFNAYFGHDVSLNCSPSAHAS